MSALDKNQPSDKAIEAIRAVYPVEREIDRLLVRKMRLRAAAGFSPVPLERLSSSVRDLVASEVSGECRLSNERWLTGGASKLQMAFTCEWNDPGRGRISRPMVLRMEPAQSIVETSRLREFQIIRAVEPHLPVPPVHWVDPEGDFLPYPALVYGLVNGVAKPSGGVARVTGLGLSYGERLRPLLAPQFIDHLVRLHHLDPSTLHLPAFDHPDTPTRAAEWQLNWWCRVWAEDAREEVPLLVVAEQWMRANLSSCGQHVLVHGDFRNGNFLFDEVTGQITAWLDWELGHVGDFHEDLAWVISRCFGHPTEDGRFLVAGLFTREEFLSAYEQQSGFRVDAATLRWYQIFVLFKCVVLTLGTGYRIVDGGKTHQDTLVAWLMAVSYVIEEEMRRLLAEEI